jgi:hypothetical protein
MTQAFYNSILISTSPSHNLFFFYTHPSSPLSLQLHKFIHLCMKHLIPSIFRIRMYVPNQRMLTYHQCKLRWWIMQALPDHIAQEKFIPSCTWWVHRLRRDPCSNRYCSQCASANLIEHHPKEGFGWQNCLETSPWKIWISSQYSSDYCRSPTSSFLCSP